MIRSEFINELAAALSKFQGSVATIKKNKTVKKVSKKTGYVTEYMYADLDSVWETIRKPLSENGLSILQTIVYAGGGNEKRPEMALETSVMHSSGQFIKTMCPLLEPQEYDYVPMQTLGGLITYAKRYGICAALGITADEDTDANEGAEIGTKTTKHEKNKPDQNNISKVENLAKSKTGFKLPKEVEERLSQKITDTAEEPPPFPLEPPAPMQTETYLSNDESSKKNDSKLKRASPAQIKRLWAVAQSKGLSNADIINECRKQFGFSDVNELDWKQYKTFVDDWMSNHETIPF